MFKKLKELLRKNEQLESNSFCEKRLVFSNAQAKTNDLSEEREEVKKGTDVSDYKNNPVLLAERHTETLYALILTEREIKRLVLENERLYREERKMHKLATTDNLTQIPNRLQYDLKLDELIPTHERNEKPFCLILIDIDDFKKFNDTYGHDIGDLILQKVAKTLKKQMPRKTDLVARYGGEEFVILVSDTDIQGAMTAAERLVEAISKIKIQHGNQELSVTISAGISEFKQKIGFIQSEDGRINNRDELFKAADIALYSSKIKGKNTATIYEKEMMMPKKMKIRGIDEVLITEQEKEKLQIELNNLLAQLGKLKEEFGDRTQMLKELKSEKLIARTKKDIAEIENKISKTDQGIKILSGKIKQIETELQKPEVKTAVA